MKKQRKNYAEILERSAAKQFISAMRQPFAVKGALMPDAHTGYSLPIGGVIATKDVVVPAWVGYDIGCGMCAIKTTFSREQIVLHRNEIFKRIYELIPTGRNRNETDGIFPALKCLPRTQDFMRIWEEKQGLKQLCSLGSGNHFIEIGYDEDDKIWVVIHSGSRGVGHGVAEHYMKLAAFSDKPLEGHFGFHTFSPMGKDYLMDMEMCLAFALENRRQMMNRVGAILYVWCGKGNYDYSTFINRNHNHVEQNKDGLWVHRKGATHAEKGMYGVIPGNWEDGSFIVRGKGNPDSLCSSSHGAGRIMSRGAARRKMNVEEERERMTNQGIVAKIQDSTIDEAKGAYKSIFEVMEQQRDLVEIVNHIRPIINIKA